MARKKSTRKQPVIKRGKPPVAQNSQMTQMLQQAIRYHQAGQLEQAEMIYHNILKIQPNHADALHLSGVLAYQKKDYALASTLIKKAIKMNNSVFDFHNHLGHVFKDQGKFSEASDCYSQASRLNPNVAEVHYNLGISLDKQGKLDEAVTCYKQALGLNPNYANVYNSLGILFRKQTKIDDAIACYQKSVRLNPNFVEAFNNLGNLYRDRGLINESIKYYKKALEICPNYIASHSNLLYTLTYSTDYDKIAIFKEHQKFNEQHVLPLAHLIKPHNNKRNPHKRLKIGYISADFRQHPVAYFIEPILTHHNHEKFEIYCYYNHPQIDEITEHLQQFVDKWVHCVGLSDESLAEKIRQDGIDILIDLSGHTAGNRLLVFARKPAPVQVTYLGYPNTTGLTVIDYHIIDKYIDLENVAEKFNSEQLIKMSYSYHCYNPIDKNMININELPAIQNNYITFGSLNNFTKLNTKTIKLWSIILNRINDSKIIIKTKSLADVETRKFLKNQFEKCRINSTRLILEDSTPAPAYLKTYHRIDIALDTYPYNGGTTTYETLWMSVPVVTLVGETQASRMGLSILSTLGLDKLIAYTPDEYVEICVELASNLDYLKELRQKMRERMLSSPLMNGKIFTHELEEHYRMMWKKWCNEVN